MYEEVSHHLLRDRYALDAVARVIVSGERGLGDELDNVADDVASIMINRLAAAGVSGHNRVAHLPWRAPERWRRVEEQYGRELLEALIRRTEKHLGQAALLALTDGA